MAHKGSYKTAKAYSEGDGPSVYTSLSAYNKMTSYSEVVKQLRGPDFDPSQNPIDSEALMIPSGGKSHGTLAVMASSLSLRLYLRSSRGKRAPLLQYGNARGQLILQLRLVFFISSFVLLSLDG